MVRIRNLSGKGRTIWLHSVSKWWPRKGSAVLSVRLDMAWWAPHTLTGHTGTGVQVHATAALLGAELTLGKSVGVDGILLWCPWPHCWSLPTFLIPPRHQTDTQCPPLSLHWTLWSELDAAIHVRDVVLAYGGCDLSMLLLAFTPTPSHFGHRPSVWTPGVGRGPTWTLRAPYLYLASVSSWWWMLGSWSQAKPIRVPPQDNRVWGRAFYLPLVKLEAPGPCPAMWRKPVRQRGAQGRANPK